MDSIFFFASKILSALLQPDTILFFLLFVAIRCLQTGNSLLSRCVSWAAVLLILVIGLLPLWHLLAYPLESRFPPGSEVPDVRGIIVLGGGEDIRQSILWGQPQTNDAGDRVIAAAVLARRYPEASVLLAGGGASLVETETGEADVASQILGGLGLDPERLIVEDRSRSTAENAVFSLELIPAAGPGAWILVTSAMHMPRAMATFCSAGWTNLVAWPTDYRTTTFKENVGWNFIRNVRAFTSALREWVGILAYRMTGRIATFDLSRCARNL